MRTDLIAWLEKARGTGRIAMLPPYTPKTGDRRRRADGYAQELIHRLSLQDDDPSLIEEVLAFRCWAEARMVGNERRSTAGRERLIGPGMRGPEEISRGVAVIANPELGHPSAGFRPLPRRPRRNWGRPASLSTRLVLLLVLASILAAALIAFSIPGTQIAADQKKIGSVTAVIVTAVFLSASVRWAARKPGAAHSAPLVREVAPEKSPGPGVAALGVYDREMDTAIGLKRNSG